MVREKKHGEPDRVPINEKAGQEPDRHRHELLALSRVSAALSGLWDLDAILTLALDNALNIRVTIVPVGILMVSIWLVRCQNNL